MAVKIYKTASSVNEGSATTFYASGFATTDKTFTYTLSTSAANVAGFADVKGATVSTGTVNISNGVAVIPLTLAADLLTEGTETLTLSYAANSITSTTGVISGSASVAGDNAVITVYDTSTDSPVKIIPSAATVNEGSTVTFNINANDGLYPYAITGTGVAVTNDYTVTTNSNVTSTTVKVVNGVGSISVVTKADAATEGLEDLILTLSVPTITTIPATVAPAAVTVRILDTSTAPTNTLMPSVASVNEGGSVMFNFANATAGTYTYTLSNNTTLASSTMTSTDASITIGATAGVFTSNKITGSVIVGSTGLVSIPVVVKSDGLTEGLESLTLNLKGTGTISSLGNATDAVGSGAISNTIVVNDTSNAIPTLSPAATSVNEGGSAVFTLNNMPVGLSGGTAYTYVLSGSGTGSIGTAPTVAGTNATHAGTTTAVLADVTATSVVAAATDVATSVSATTGVLAKAVGDMTGTITVPFGKTSGSVSVPLNADHVTEAGGEMLTMAIESSVAAIHGISAAVFVNDSSKDYAYSLNPSTAAVNEGGAVTFTITDGKPGQVVTPKFLTVSASTGFGAAVEADFTAAQGTVGTPGTAAVSSLTFGSVTIGADGKATFPVYVRFDHEYDGANSSGVAHTVALAEKFAVQLYDTATTPALITTVGTNTVIINDTSFA